MVASVCGQARRLAVGAVLATGVMLSPALAQEGAKPAEPQPEKKKEEPAQPAPNPELEAALKKLQEEAAKRGVTFTKPTPAAPGQPNQPGQPAAQIQPAPAQPAPAQPKPAQANPVQANPGQPGQVQPPAQPASKPQNGKSEKGEKAGKSKSPEKSSEGVGAGGKGTITPMPQTPAMPATAATAAVDHGPVEVPEGMVRLEFTDAVEIMLLVKFVSDTLGLQLLLTDGGLAGQKVTFTEPITIKREKLLPFLLEVLESKDYTIVQNQAGLYVVQPKQGIQPAIGDGPFMTTRVIHTPNIKPTQLQTVVTNLLAGSRGATAGTPGGAPTYLDDLGVIIITDTPRVTALVQSVVDQLVAERGKLKYTRFELNHIAATSARDRVLELTGQAAQRVASNPQVPGQPVPPIAGPGSTILNLSERMTVDPSSNALLFRGREDESEFIQQLLSIVDVPNSLISRFYPVGLSTAEAVANAGSKEQLGGQTTFESTSSRSSGGARSGASVPGTAPGFGSSSQGDFAGAGFVLYPEAGGFIYRGTPTQHERVQALIAGLKDLSERDRVVIEFYKLKHSKSTDVTDVVQNLLNNSTPSGNRGLVGRNVGGTNRRNNPSQRNTPNNPAAAAAAAVNNAAGASGDASGLGEINGEEVFVIADEGNNQVVVKAPQKLQPQFKQLIQRIDLRRPQVYLDAKIMVVTSTEGLDVTTEVQQIIGQFAFNTNFGLGSLTSTSGSGTTTTTTGGLESRKIPNAGLSGLTTALIRSKDVPILVNALARNVDGRVVATPQLLVDDNSEAEIKSKDQQPTSTISQSNGTGNNLQGFGGFEEAGPSLKIKPQIADGGYLRLEYEIELSSFTGAPSNGLPSPKQTNNIKSESVTVPTDCTVVVGGLVSENNGKTVLKIPLLGDIPIVGELFRDTSITKSRTTLFVFITPKIMRDPTFADLRLLTSKPLVSLDLPSEVPAPEPVRIDVIDTATAQTREQEKDLREENKRRETSEPKKKKGRSDTDPWG